LIVLNNENILIIRTANPQLMMIRDEAPLDRTIKPSNALFINLSSA